MPTEVQKKMLDIGLKILSACMIPVLAWAYHLSIDVAVIKAKEEVMEESIKKNSSSIRTLNEETNKIDVIETNIKNMASQLDKAEKTLDKIIEKL
tara:strand:- start:22 stop:306 length:285 start_codon:yes stop_codon:yes gene_type:complete